jgi:hypothetical protein
MAWSIARQPETGLWVVIDNGQILGRAALPITAINLARERADAINDPITGRGPGSIPPLTPAISTQLQAQARQIEQQEQTPTTSNPPDPQVSSVSQPTVAVPQAQTSAAADPQSGNFVFGPDGELIPADSAEALDQRAAEDRVEYTAPPTVGGNFTEVFDPETGLWNVENLDTGEVIETGLTQQQAILAAQDASVGGTGYPPGTGADTADPGLTPAQITEQQQSAADKEAALARARAQATLSAQQAQADQGDWRVKLRLAPGATYLYEDPTPGILAPLSTRSGTGGVVFPYTPSISTSYNARYQPYDLTHSNYRGYFYSGSHVEAVTLTAQFTAQDSQEAAYLLAVIHFFRSVTKMFYGQDDAFAGAPPPLVYLQGLGQYQFALHPCAVTQFNYNLPSDVDYIRANSPTINGTNLLQKRQRGPGVPTDPFTSAWARIQNVLKPQGVNKGAVPLGAQDNIPVFGTDRPTYVPTKMEITLSLLPMQSRQQVSRQFTLKGYANGNLLRGPTNQPGAFW